MIHQMKAGDEGHTSRSDISNRGETGYSRCNPLILDSMLPLPHMGLHADNTRIKRVNSSILK